MAQESAFFNAQLAGEEYDRVYLAETFAAYFASFIGNGIFGGSMQELEVAAQDVANMTTKVLSGKAWINGYWFRNTDSYTLQHSVADGVLSRIDLVVVRWDNAARDMYLHVIEGTPSSNPVAPQLVRNSDYYDLGLAQVSIPAGNIGITQAQITDLRLSSDFCGLVTGVIDQIDLTDLFNQFTQYFTEFKQKYEKDYANWTAEQKEAYNRWVRDQKEAYEQYISGLQDDYDQWTAAKKTEWAQWVTKNEEEFESWTADKTSEYDQWTDEQRQAYANWYGVHTVEWEAAFDEWFASIKDKFAGDPAGNLQNQIDELKAEQPVELVATIEHNMDAYLHCDLFETEYACGTQGAGDGPCGGGPLVSTPLKYEMEDRNNIKVMAKAGYGVVESVAKIGDGLYAVLFQQKQVSLVVMLSNVCVQYQKQNKG